MNYTMFTVSINTSLAFGYTGIYYATEGYVFSYK